MTRIARVIVPGLPHHVTQRGNRGERVFLGNDDYALYHDWMAQSCARFGVSVWAYCLMPNHVHLILAPGDDMGLALAMGRTHRLYAGYFNARARQTGHLFQGRFGSVAMDEDHLMLAARYVALNPVRARLVAEASDWPHSSVRAHLALSTSVRCCDAPRISPISSTRMRTIPPSPRFVAANSSAARWDRNNSSPTSSASWDARCGPANAGESRRTKQGPLKGKGGRVTNYLL
jgi:REP element-mobilizing transposase RayT